LIVWGGSLRRVIINLAKYCKTPMPFFFNLHYHEFLLWLVDVGEMAEEEAAEINASSKPPQQDLSKVTQGWST
jgi:hypothetical protein